MKSTRRFGLMARFAPLSAQGIVDEIAGDAAKPGAQFARLAQFGKLFPGGDECFLGQVLALTETAGGAVRERADERLIPAHDLPEGFAVSREALGHELGIIGFHCFDGI